MKKYLSLIVLVLISLGMSACVQTTSLNSTNPRKLKVRLTTYSKTEKRCDKWTKRGKSSTGIKLKEGLSAAVDPNLIPYFSKIKIPELRLELCALDTGSAVIKRTASRRTGRNEPIIDIYFNKEYDARKFRLSNPQIVEALIFN